ncbi:hypothetical protein [Ralstonia phage RP13]|nr:hypothetical protein [Ralstonia phage RP13]
MALTLAGLQSAVKAFQDKKNDQSGDWPKTTFLPEGTHKGRFITDPKDEFMTDYWAFGYFNKGIRDPDSVPTEQKPEGFVNELKSFYEEKFKPLNQWKYGAKKNVIALFYLHETDAQSDNWQPGNLYYIVTNNKFADAYTQFLAMLAKDAPEEVIKTLDPAQAGVLLTLQFKGGQQGSCSIGAAFPQKMLEPIDVTKHVYVSLEDAYIKPGFNLDKYNTLLESYKQAYAKLSGQTAAAPAGTTETSLGDAPNTEASGQSMIPGQQQQPASQEQANESQAQQAAAPAVDQPVQEQAVQAQPAAETAVQSTAPAAAGGASVWDKFKSKPTA